MALVSSSKHKVELALAVTGKETAAFLSKGPFAKAVEAHVPFRITVINPLMLLELTGKCAIWLCHKKHHLV